MGMFSWIDVTGDENICYSDDKVICLIPEEHRDAVSKVFGIELGKTGVEGKYDGYGVIITKEGTEVDIYDVTPFLNICCTTDKQYKDMLQYKTTDGNERTRLDNISKACADEIRQAYKDGKIETIADIVNIITNYDDEFRSLGIDLACYDEDNAKLPYPIKITVSDYQTYENSSFSMSDPNQGFNKTTKARLSDVEYREEDWDWDDKYIEDEVWNEETGEYDTIEIENPDYTDPYDRWEMSDEHSEYEDIMELDEIEEKRESILASLGEEVKEAQVQYHKPYSLVGIDGNAFSIMGYTAKAMREVGLKDEVEEMRTKATSGEYYNLIAVCDGYIDRCNELLKKPRTIEKEDVKEHTSQTQKKGEIR